MSSSTTAPNSLTRARAIELRRYPYPYRALMAICSDLDETPDKSVYLESSRYLNTTSETCMGPGVGLEIGNTIYFDMPADQFSYWNTDEHGREAVRALIKSGHIDCLHSYGDFADTREKCARSIEDLHKHGAHIGVWIDHAVAPSNLGADIMKGSGDLPDSPVYHADLTRALGVEYVWRGRVTSVVGQNVGRKFSGIFDATHAMPSAKTLAKEVAKTALSFAGNRKYAIHKENAILRRERLRDGAPVYEFLRCNPYWMGVNRGETATGIAEVMSDRMLDTLIAREGTCILYTHLGKVKDPREPFQKPTRAAFERLAQRSRGGKMLVATTRRLLGYCRAVKEIELTVSGDNGTQRVQIRSGKLRPEDLQGLTFYCDDPNKVTIEVDEKAVAVEKNPEDHTGRRSVSLPWKQLEYPQF